MDNIDRKLINLIQTAFPISREPYAELGQRLNIDADNVIHRIMQLKDRGIVRQIGPVMDSRNLGYQTTLIAMTITNNNFEKIDRIINEHSGVSHGYERDHPFNIWLTLAVPPGITIETEVEKLVRTTGAQAVISLPAINVFKIGAYFDMYDEIQDTPAPTQTNISDKQVELSSTEKIIINELQQELPLIHTPFDAMAKRSGMDIEQFLTQCQLLQQRNIIRRFSASINHNCAGFVANAMTCWATPPDTVDIAGQKLASLKEVSHCYERKTSSLWPYNLFAMIHGRSRETCREIADEVSHQSGLTDYVSLYSTREIKKKRIKYLL